MEQLLQDLMQVIKKHSPQTEMPKEFILSDPEFKEEWQPVAGSSVEVSDNNYDWYIRSFVSMCPSGSYVVYCPNINCSYTYQYCRPSKSEPKLKSYDVLQNLKDDADIITIKGGSGYNANQWKVIHSFEV